VGIAVGSGLGVAVGAGLGVAAGAAVIVGVAVQSAVGIAARVSVEAGGDGGAPWAGELDAPGLAGGVVDGDAVGLPVELGWGPASLTALRVRLKPARASATATDGPRSTCRVKEPRPRWPETLLPDGVPSRPPIVGRFFLPSLNGG
jgi:hypothetical protein